MALVAKMVAHEVTGRSGTRYEQCGPDEPDARPVEDVFGNYAYGVPVWLQGASHVRTVVGQGSEQIKLQCVRTDDPNDPNNQWWTASPSGTLEMHIENPEGFGYVVPGAEYRITIERIRGPRSKEREQLAAEAEQAARQ